MADPEALRLAVRGLVYVALACFAAALIFAVMFGVMSPVFRRLATRLRRQKRELRAAIKVAVGLKNDLAVGVVRIKASEERERRLEIACTGYERELRRVDKIRERAEVGCARKHKELEVAQLQLSGVLRIVDELTTTESPS